jgi:Na+/proline symporter
MQIVLGYLLGYATIVHILLPIYYRLNLTTIYTYLKTRFGKVSYKTGASFFLISRLIGAAFRLFIVANILQITVFDKLHVPFIITVILTLLLIYIYTFRGGIKTIVWTDTLQTILFLLSVTLTIILLSKAMNFDLKGLVQSLKSSEYSTIFNFHDWKKDSYFLKQFFSGAFIAIVMTGLDQDMMQKNLSCRNLKEAQKNMYWYSSMLVPVNLLFLSLGALLVLYVRSNNIPIPERSDDLFPMIATGGYLPLYVGIIFILGLIAAAYSSADSALTALTTSFTIDILSAGNLPEKKLRNIRWTVHILMACLMGIIIFVFRVLNNEAVISSLFTAAGYTYGPLLGLFAFGIFSKRKVKDMWVPFVAILSPLVTFLIKEGFELLFTDYRSSYELLLFNGLITISGLLIISKKTRARPVDFSVVKEK